MDEAFSQAVIGRLKAQERSCAWLARRLQLKSRQRLDHYLHGRREWPAEVKQAIAVLLDIRTEKAA